MPSSFSTSSGSSSREGPVVVDNLRCKAPFPQTTSATTKSPATYRTRLSGRGKKLAGGSGRRFGCCIVFVFETQRNLSFLNSLDSFLLHASKCRFDRGSCRFDGFNYFEKRELNKPVPLLEKIKRRRWRAVNRKLAGDIFSLMPAVLL